MFSYSREIQKAIGDAKQGVKSSPRQRTRILLRKTRRIHMNVQEIVNNRYGKGIAQCSNEEIYYALLEMTKSMAKEKESNEGKRKLY